MSAAASLGANALRLAAIVFIGYTAYTIRLNAITEYGKVIHEFDPWFNYRATVYLEANGAEKFFSWYDHESWYPLGRPVGTTIYPGMQFASVWLYRGLNAAGYEISLNDTCCYVPAWFGVVATMFLGMLAYESTGSANAGVAAAGIMAIIPAHIMRSVGGGFDNESVAMTTMCATFYFWVRALRKDSYSAVLFGVVSGLAYFAMVATWGGYVFVINMVGMHAGVLVLMGNFSPRLHKAYTLFYVIGTALATTVPVVGWTPLKSLEQLGALGVFGVIQLFEITRRVGETKNMGEHELTKFRRTVFLGAGAVGAVVAAYLFTTGFFGPLSSRIRSLFVPHTRTGNPLVDSVAEHQPASAGAYYSYLQNILFLAPFGWGSLAFKKRNDQTMFLILYAVAASYFCNKMVRLIILMAPVASALGGYALVNTLTWIYSELTASPEAAAPAAAKEGAKKKGSATTPAKKGSKASAKKKMRVAGGDKGPLEMLGFGPLMDAWSSDEFATGRKVVCGVALVAVLRMGVGFYGYSQAMAIRFSQPSIMYKANLRDGQSIIVDDYREAYWWLRDNTPKDSRILAWWDYGYQIAGVAERTTLADGNTWNHEHIATIGRILTAPVTDAHRIARHLADYVLVWAGGGGDDLAKSPHMARIGNSVYPGLCPNDPTCSRFGFLSDGSPTDMMGASLLYNMIWHKQKPGVELDPDRFEQVYSSKYGKVRIFKVLKVDQESKAWVANPANKICDRPGSWYCVGQYPPKIDWLIKTRKNFKQLEDFNAKTDSEDEEYQRQYHARMAGRVKK